MVPIFATFSPANLSIIFETNKKEGEKVTLQPHKEAVFTYVEACFSYVVVMLL